MKIKNRYTFQEVLYFLLPFVYFSNCQKELPISTHSSLLTFQCVPHWMSSDWRSKWYQWIDWTCVHLTTLFWCYMYSFKDDCRYICQKNTVHSSTFWMVVAPDFVCSLCGTDALLYHWLRPLLNRSAHRAMTSTGCDLFGCQTHRCYYCSHWHTRPLYIYSSLPQSHKMSAMLDCTTADWKCRTLTLKFNILKGCTVSSMNTLWSMNKLLHLGYMPV